MNDPTEVDVLSEVSKLADKLAITIDDRFDFSLSSEFRDERLLKMVMMINFILERARDNIDQLAQSKAELEDKVKERTAVLELVIRGSSAGVWFWHVKDNRLEVSDLFAQISNKKAESLDSLEAWINLLHPEDARGLQNAVREYINGASAKLEYRYRISDGYNHYRWAVMQGALERDDFGNPMILAGTQTDITPLVAVDQESSMPNEVAFKEWLSSRLAKDALPAFVAILSIDNFNEVSGSLLGDQLERLKVEMRNRIQSSLPISAFIAKLPSGSFGIGISEPKTSPAEILAKLFKSFDHPLEVQGHGPVKMSVSAGALTLPSSIQETSLDTCLAALWSGVRKARLTDGNLLVQFNEQLREEQMKKQRITAEVRTAITEDRIIAFLQPILSSRSHEVASFEALVRMQTTTGEFIPPFDFIPIIENSDLIIPLTESVLRQALTCLKQFIEDGLCSPATSVAVNIAPLHLLSGDLPRLVLSELKAMDIPPELLKLEITETALMNNMDVAVEQLSMLRKIGCKIAIDDFGTGYSSLEYLHTLPVDVLKLDRAFVQKIGTSTKTAAIAKTVCDLASILSLEIVAEGVEEQAEMDALENMGATFLQGYYFCRPLPRIEVSEWLLTKRGNH